MNRPQQAFVQWVARNDPFIYNIARHRAAAQAQLNGMGAITDIFSSIVDTIKNVAPSVIQMKSQKKILDMQIERAKQGLPPIDASAYTPTVKVEAALSPESEAAAQRIAVESVKSGIEGMKPIFFGALALGAFLLFKNRR